MIQYKKMLEEVLANGTHKSDRTGTGTLSIFGHQSRYNLQDGLPVVTTKKIHLKSIIHELVWFLSKNTNIKYLQDNNVKIWDAWASPTGELGRIYQSQWTDWISPDGKHINQIAEVIEQIKINPDSRRLIVTAWNPGELEYMALPPCHCFFQFYVNDGKLSCQLYQRSADLFLGVPFNITSYSILTHMVAQVCGLQVGEFIHTIGDLHLYKDHIELAEIQLTRECLKPPVLRLNPLVDNIFDFKYEDVVIEGYESHGKLLGNVSV